MKKIFYLQTAFLSFLLALFLMPAANAQVYEGDLTLTSQAEIDTFSYTEITGDLRIEEETEGNITNLDSLSGLTAIGGHLYIANNSLLQNIDGLSNIDTLNHTFDAIVLYILNNNSLTNLDGLSGLTYLRGRNLEMGSSGVYISSNNSLANIDGLSNLKAVMGRFTIDGNPMLTNLDGLSGLTSVQSSIIISSNPSLTNLDGLSNLNFSTISIGNNNNLSDISGLAHDTITNNINIGSNALLTNLDGLAGVTTINGNIRISNPYLNNISGLSSLTDFNGALGIFNTSLSNLNGLENLESLDALTLRENSSLKNIDALYNLTALGKNEPEAGILFIYGNDSLTNLDGLRNSYPVTLAPHLDIIQNSSLVDFCGITGLVEHDPEFETRFVEIYGNAYNPSEEDIMNGNCSQENVYFGDLYLTTQAQIDTFSYNSVIGHLCIYESTEGDITNVDGLSELMHTGSLRIVMNSALTNLDSLSNLSSIGKLEILDNASLTGFCGLYNLLSSGTTSGDFIISGNVINPTKQQIIDAGPCLESGGQTYIGDLTLRDQADIDKFNYNIITGTLTIEESSPGAITNLNGLSELTEIGLDLWIKENSELINVDSLVNLKFVRYIYIRENASLQNIDGFSGIDSLSNGGIAIGENPALINVDGLHNLKWAKLSVGIVNCNSLTSIDGLSGLDSAGSFGLNANEILSNLDGLLNLKKIKAGLSITNCPGLKNIDGLNNLTYVAEYIELGNNDSLLNLDGLSNLTSLGTLIISNNYSLNNLNGLSNVLHFNGNVFVQDNTSLTEFCGLYSIFTNGHTESVTISGNAANPTKQEIIDAGPCSESDPGNTLTDVNNLEGIPDEFALAQNYPNPFNPTTTIRYDLPEAAFVKLTVYNSLGEAVSTLVNESKDAGRYEAVFNASALSSGIYFYRIETGNFVQTNKLLLLK